MSVTHPRPPSNSPNEWWRRIDSASLALLMSVGHQTGLLDTMAGLAPSTSAQIAAAAGLNERYVREWLGGMTTGHIVEYDAENGTYSLPAHRAGVLTRAAGPNNLALVAQFIPLLGEVEQTGRRLLPRRAAGCPTANFPRFHTLMAEDEWRGVRRRARRRRAAVGRRTAGPAAVGRRRRRFRLRQRARGERDGARVSGEPVHRRRLLRGRHRGGNRGRRLASG